MSRARKIARPGALSYQSLERSRGTFAPIDPDRHYIVEPGEPGNGPEYFPKPGQAPLKGLEDAISRAAWLSMAHGHQAVIRVSPDSGPRPVRWYAGGHALALVPGPSDQSGDRDGKRP